MKDFNEIEGEKYVFSDDWIFERRNQQKWNRTDQKGRKSPWNVKKDEWNVCGFLLCWWWNVITKLVCAHTMLIVTRLIYKWQKTAKWFGLWYQSSDTKSYRYVYTYFYMYRKKLLRFWLLLFSVCSNGARETTTVLSNWNVSNITFIGMDIRFTRLIRAAEAAKAATAKATSAHQYVYACAGSVCCCCLVVVLFFSFFVRSFVRSFFFFRCDRCRLLLENICCFSCLLLRSTVCWTKLALFSELWVSMCRSFY